MTGQQADERTAATGLRLPLLVLALAALGMYLFLLLNQWMAEQGGRTLQW